MNRGAAVYAAIPGGAELIAWFGREPSFHDAEIVSLHLRRRSESILQIFFWRLPGGVDNRGHFQQDKHVVVSFVMGEIVDLQLDYFGHQNVIYSLKLGRASDRPDRAPYIPLTDPRPTDYEIELEPCYGMGGFIRCRKLSIVLTPGKPDDAR